MEQLLSSSVATRRDLLKLTSSALVAAPTLLLPKRSLASAAPPSIPSSLVATVASSHSSHWNSCDSIHNTTQPIAASAQAAIIALVNNLNSSGAMNSIQGAWSSYPTIWTWSASQAASAIAAVGFPMPSGFLTLMPGFTPTHSFAKQTATGKLAVSQMTTVANSMFLNWSLWFNSGGDVGQGGWYNEQCYSCKQGSQDGPPIPQAAITNLLAGAAGCISLGGILLSGTVATTVAEVTGLSVLTVTTGGTALLIIGGALLAGAVVGSLTDLGDEVVPPPPPSE